MDGLIDMMCSHIFMYAYICRWYREFLQTLLGQALASDGDTIGHSLALIKTLDVANKNVNLAYAEEGR